MNYSDFIETSRDWIAEGGKYGVVYAANQLWMSVLRSLSPLFEQGTNIYEKDWDLLVILDGCRVDAIEEVAAEYEFLDSPGTHRSTASTSGEWMRTTFIEKHQDKIQNTIYVTANDHSSEVKELNFFEFEDVYNYGWNDARY